MNAHVYLIKEAMGGSIWSKLKMPGLLGATSKNLQSALQRSGMDLGEGVVQTGADALTQYARHLAKLKQEIGEQMAKRMAGLE
jgi:hypothetical protein